MTESMPAVPKVLAVDDTPANLVAIRRLLSGFELELVEARGGEEALAACADQDLALILLDVAMPGMDGFEVAQNLSRKKNTRDTPIIFVTAARPDELSRIRGYGSGAVDYIVKPINDVILQSKVRVFLDLYLGKQELRRALEEQRRLQALAVHEATHDPLTGLPNRQLFMDRLDRLLRRVKRRATSGAMLYIDIDGFKPVNDRYGHQAGDELLKAIAGRMTETMRTVDTIARLGGDEFAVLMEEPVKPLDAVKKAERLCLALSQPYVLQVPGESAPLTVTVGASIGIAVCPDDAIEADALIHVADSAMYRAKRQGTNLCLRAETASRKEEGGI